MHTLQTKQQKPPSKTEVATTEGNSGLPVSSTCQVEETQQQKLPTQAITESDLETDPDIVSCLFNTFKQFYIHVCVCVCVCVCVQYSAWVTQVLYLPYRTVFERPGAVQLIARPHPLKYRTAQPTIQHKASFTRLIRQSYAYEANCCGVEEL